MRGCFRWPAGVGPPGPLGPADRTTPLTQGARGYSQTARSPGFTLRSRPVQSRGSRRQVVGVQGSGGVDPASPEHWVVASTRSRAFATLRFAADDDRGATQARPKRDVTRCSARVGWVSCRLERVVLFVPKGNALLPATGGPRPAEQRKDPHPSRIAWSRLLARVFRVDVMVCAPREQSCAPSHDHVAWLRGALDELLGPSPR